MAARQGKSQVIEVLIAAGANLQHRDCDEMSALDLAEKYNHHEIAAILKSKNSVMNENGNSNFTRKELACYLRVYLL